MIGRFVGIVWRAFKRDHLIIEQMDLCRIGLCSSWKTCHRLHYLMGIDQAKLGLSITCCILDLLFNSVPEIWANSGLFFVLFLSFSLSNNNYSFNFKFNDTKWKNVDGVLGIRTQGRRVVGADKTTELFRSCNFNFSCILCSLVYSNLIGYWNIFDQSRCLKWA